MLSHSVLRLAKALCQSSVTVGFGVTPGASRRKHWAGRWGVRPATRVMTSDGTDVVLLGRRGVECETRAGFNRMWSRTSRGLLLHEEVRRPSPAQSPRCENTIRVAYSVFDDWGRQLRS